MAFGEVTSSFITPRSQSCVHLYNAWIQDGYLYMQMELCSGGSLLDYLEGRGKDGGVEEELVWKIFLMVGKVNIYNIMQRDWQTFIS
jgi:hypothetical protein